MYSEALQASCYSVRGEQLRTDRLDLHLVRIALDDHVLL